VSTPNPDPESVRLYGHGGRSHLVDFMTGVDSGETICGVRGWTLHRYVASFGGYGRSGSHGAVAARPLCKTCERAAKARRARIAGGAS